MNPNKKEKNAEKHWFFGTSDASRVGDTGWEHQLP
jgi:hypothetical protein